MREQYEQASQFYATLHGQYEDLHYQYNRLSTDIVTARDDIAGFQTALDEQRRLKEAAETQLRHANGELSVLATQNTELRACCDTIGILQKTIDGKNAKITNLEGELEQRRKHAAEAIRGHEAAVAEVGRLKATIMAHEFRAGQLKEEVAALTAKSDAQELRSLSRQFSPVKDAMGMRFQEHRHMDSSSIVVDTKEGTGKERRRKKPKQHNEVPSSVTVEQGM